MRIVLEYKSDNSWDVIELYENLRKEKPEKLMFSGLTLMEALDRLDQYKGLRKVVRAEQLNLFEEQKNA